MTLDQPSESAAEAKPEYPGATVNPPANAEALVDDFLTTLATNYLITQQSTECTATLEDVRRALCTSVEQQAQDHYATAFDAVQRTRLVEIVDAFVARSADKFVAAGVKDSRHTGCYL